MKHRILFVAILVATIFAVLAPATPAAASTSGDFLSDINGLRASKGLGALSVNSSLSSFAQAWAEKMAAAGSISHNPALSNAPGAWTTVGENVGVGGSEDSIFNALVASSGHYANMVNSKFNSIGIGVAVGSDGRIYTTHDFAAYPGSSSPAPSKAPASSPTTSKPAATHSTQAAPAPKPAPATTAAPAAPAPTTAAPAPAPAAEAALTPATASAPAAAASELPTPSGRIVDGLVQVSQISTQG